MCVKCQSGLNSIVGSRWASKRFCCNISLYCRWPKYQKRAMEESTFIIIIVVALIVKVIIWIAICEYRCYPRQVRMETWWSSVVLRLPSSPCGVMLITAGFQSEDCRFQSQWAQKFTSFPKANIQQYQPYNMENSFK